MWGRYDTSSRFDASYVLKLGRLHVIWWGWAWHQATVASLQAEYLIQYGCTLPLRLSHGRPWPHEQMSQMIWLDSTVSGLAAYVGHWRTVHSEEPRDLVEIGGKG